MISATIRTYCLHLSRDSVAYALSTRQVSSLSGRRGQASHSRWDGNKVVLATLTNDGLQVGLRLRTGNTFAIFVKCPAVIAALQLSLTEPALRKRGKPAKHKVTVHDKVVSSLGCRC